MALSRTSKVARLVQNGISTTGSKLEIWAPFYGEQIDELPSYPLKAVAGHQSVRFEFV